MKHRTRDLAGGRYPLSLQGKTAYTQTFTGNGTWTRPLGVNVVEVCLVGGGGGGGGGTWVDGATDPAPGGGGGGVVYAWVDVSNVSSVAVTIGGGGAGGAPNYYNSGVPEQTIPTVAGRGTNSTFGSFLTALGGGGASWWGDSSNRFSALGSSTPGQTGSGVPTLGFGNLMTTPGQGNLGGTYLYGTIASGTWEVGGSGGGAGTAATNPSSSGAGAGGSGKTVMGTTYGGGGGGGALYKSGTVSDQRATGGSGGGGAGYGRVSGSPVAAVAGTANSGGGGGGEAGITTGKAGGSGICIVRWYL